MKGDCFEHYVELVQARVTRTELWDRLPAGWWAGAQGGPAWLNSPEHVRPDEPRFYERPVRLFDFPGQARMHYAVGDLRLRRVSIVLDPIPRTADGAGGALAASLLNFVSHASPNQSGCKIYGALHAHELGIQVVIDIEAVPDPEPSMEEFFIWD
jgi:hypothetical protein